MAWHGWASRMVIWGLGQLLLIFMLLTSPSAAQWDPTTGYITAIAGAGAPSFDPVPWNTAYKVTFRNVPFNGTFEGSWRLWPYTPDSEINTMEDCFIEGFDDASAVNASVVSHCYGINHMHSRRLAACMSNFRVCTCCPTLCGIHGVVKHCGITSTPQCLMPLMRWVACAGHVV
jgi:hypothetical protein